MICQEDQNISRAKFEKHTKKLTLVHIKHFQLKLLVYGAIVPDYSFILISSCTSK